MPHLLRPVVHYFLPFLLLPPSPLLSLTDTVLGTGTILVLISVSYLGYVRDLA
jgi:hypothetical protein